MAGYGGDWAADKVEGALGCKIEKEKKGDGWHGTGKTGKDRN